MVVVDTCLLVDLDEAHEGAKALAQELEAAGETFLLPAAVWAEYLAGIREPYRARRAHQLSRSTHVVSFDRATADEAIRLQSERMAEGRPMSWHDVQVAATAIHHREPLVSRDTVFQGIPSLEVRTW